MDLKVSMTARRYKFLRSSHSSCRERCLQLIQPSRAGVKAVTVVWILFFGLVFGSKSAPSRDPNLPYSQKLAFDDCSLPQDYWGTVPVSDRGSFTSSFGHDAYPNHDIRLAM